MTTILAATCAVILSSCILAENDEYVVQDAPPNGIHVTIQKDPTKLLTALSSLVDQGADADLYLRQADFSTRCNSMANTAENGDRCAFTVLREIKVTGSMAGSWWNDAKNWDMFSDFHDTAMQPFRDAPKTMADGCLHVTIKNVGDWPIEWKNSNWTTRTRSDPKC